MGFKEEYAKDLEHLNLKARSSMEGELVAFVEKSTYLDDHPDATFIVCEAIMKGFEIGMRLSTSFATEQILKMRKREGLSG